MPTDFSIVNVQTAAPAALPSGRSAGPAALASLARERPPETSQVPHPDSALTLDPAADRVVMEYFDATGMLTHSIPSRQQLEAYRLAALAGEAAKRRI